MRSKHAEFHAQYMTGVYKMRNAENKMFLFYSSLHNTRRDRGR